MKPGDALKQTTETLKQFILAQDNAAYDDKYWSSVIQGLEHLFLLKEIEPDKQSFMVNFYELRVSVLDETDNRFIEDLVDELNAILIRDYPMPDFWSSTILDFKTHVNFKKHFTE